MFHALRKCKVTNSAFAAMATVLSFSMLPIEARSAAEPFRYLGGCGTLIHVEKVTNIEPRYNDARPREGLRTHGAVELSVLAAMFPGVGHVAAFLIGSGIAMVVHAFGDNRADAAAAESVKNQSWENTYQMTIKPDFGDEFTVPIQLQYQLMPEPGGRTLFATTESHPDFIGHMRIIFRGKITQEIGSEEYMKACVGNLKFGYRHLEYKDGQFAWGEMPALLQESIDRIKAAAEQKTAEN